MTSLKIKDIKFNNKQSAEFLPKIYQKQDADAVIINSNYAIDQKLNPKKIQSHMKKLKIIHMLT